MSRYNHHQDLTWKNYALLALIVSASVALVVWFLPQGGRSSYRFDIGKPWPYSQFIAPYDFPILKTEAQLQQEHDSIRRLYAPYFELQADREVEQLTRFRTDLSQQIHTQMTAGYRSVIERWLHWAYSRGIVSGADADLLTKDSCDMVRIIVGTEAHEQSVEQLFTQKTAYQFLQQMSDSLGLNKAFLQRLDIAAYIQPNLIYNAKKSEELWADLQSSLSPSSGMVLAGQNVIDRGDIVDEQAFNILRSYELANENRSGNDAGWRMSLLGRILYVAMVILGLTAYFFLFRQDYVGSIRSVSLLVVLGLLFPLMTSFMIRHNILTVYIIPYAILPIFIRVFMDSRTAFVAHVAVIMLCAVGLKYPFEFITTQSMAGIVAIYSLRELSERSQIIRTAFFVTLASLLFYLSIELMNGKLLFGGDSMTTLDKHIYQHIALSGVLLMFAYPAMSLLERVFGFTSNVTLVELSNINRDLLHRLSEVAPGTFQHSMQVSNLAAEVARKLGAKSQLVRTGALYHDIGKIYNPPFFTENQRGGVNPHTQLTNEESARIIIRHVTEGVAMADKYQLPQAIRDFIATHHGKGIVKYFYISAKNAAPGKDLDPTPYTYPGPNPFTMEQAILTMADAVEASSRSLSDYSEESIGQLVDRIIDAQVQEGLFKQCPITFLDIETAKQVLKDRLKIIYHTRISYPTLNTSEPSTLTEGQSGSTSK